MWEAVHWHTLIVEGNRGEFHSGEGLPQPRAFVTNQTKRFTGVLKFKRTPDMKGRIQIECPAEPDDFLQASLIVKEFEAVVSIKILPRPIHVPACVKIENQTVRQTRGSLMLGTQPVQMVMKTCGAAHLTNHTNQYLGM